MCGHAVCQTSARAEAATPQASLSRRRSQEGTKVRARLGQVWGRWLGAGRRAANLKGPGCVPHMRGIHARLAVCSALFVDTLRAEYSAAGDARPSARMGSSQSLPQRLFAGIRNGSTLEVQVCTARMACASWAMAALARALAAAATAACACVLPAADSQRPAAHACALWPYNNLRAATGAHRTPCAPRVGRPRQAAPRWRRC